LLDEHFDSFQQLYDQRYQENYGYWRPIVEQSVAAFLKCGDLEEGFARVRCPDCKHEMFVAFSCKQLGKLSSCAWTCLQAEVRRMLGRDDVVPGMIGAIQTHDQLLHWHPHLHVLITCGAWTAEDTGQVIYQSQKQACRAFPDPKGDGMRKKAAVVASAEAPTEPPAEQAASQRSSQAWAMLIKRVYDVDPLCCPECGGQMKVVSFIEPPQADVIEAILKHCGLSLNPCSSCRRIRTADIGP